MYELSHIIKLNLNQFYGTSSYCGVTGGIKKVTNTLPSDFTPIGMPVIFDQFNGKFLAATSNIVNCYVNSNKIQYPNPFNPLFKKDIESKIAGAKEVDCWAYHILMGEVHCATNARRELSDRKWWNHIEK